MPEAVTIRTATGADRSALRGAIVELQDYERLLHDTRLPGEQIADAYLDWMLRRASTHGAVLVAELGGVFVGFAAGWIDVSENVAETPESNRCGYVSDVCVLPPFRGRRIATQLLDAVESHLRSNGITRLRITSLAANTAAQASYTRSGFRPYEVTYEKRLDAS